MNDFSQTIQLPHSIIIQGPIIENSFKILEVIDNFNDKTVNARIEIGSTNPIRNNFIVWQGDDYDQIGDWTTSQINNKVSEIITNLYPANTQ